MDFLILIIIICYVLAGVGYISFLFHQRDALHKWGYGFMWAGFVCHTGLLFWSVAETGLFPAHNMPQTLAVSGWALTAFFLLFQYRYPLKVLGIYAAPLAALLMILSTGMPDTPARIEPSLKNFWVILHVVIIFISYAAFTLACGAGILYLIQEHAIKTKKRGFFFRRLPSLEQLDNTGYICLATGFTAITIGLISGIIYAKWIWGRFWNWDPKEVWSAILWLFYAALLHERLTVGWRGRKSAVMSIIGFAVLLFTFIGVNFFLQGHHGEFTQW